eukprot:3442619-Heterocapsa_arctica.AAC.1
MGVRLASSPLSASETVSIKSTPPRPVSWSILRWFKKSPGSATSPAALPLADSVSRQSLGGLALKTEQDAENKAVAEAVEVAAPNLG